MDAQSGICNSDRWVFIRDEGAQIQKLGVFWANDRKWYIDGLETWYRIIGRQIGIEKVKYSRFDGHIHVQFRRK